MNEVQQIARFLLQIKAIKLQPATPFTWTSGWESPIYCDNRQTLSYPQIRTYITNAFIRKIKKKYADAEVIAGVATGAIAHGVLVAGVLKLPFVYVRSENKSHGMQNKIEGHIETGQKVVVIEDLISTGDSSLKTVAALREAKCEVLGMLAIFTYGFDISKNSFANSNCELTTLSNYDTLIEEAVSSGFISRSDIEQLKKWKKDPEKWNKH